MLFRGLALAGIIILLLLLWKQQTDLARLKKDNAFLQQQNLGLLDNSLKPQPVAATPAPPAPAKVPGISAQTAADLRPHPSPSEKNRLIFTGTEITQTTNGLVAIMRFKPSKTGPLGLVAMSVRLPGNIDATIQSIKPLGSAVYDDSDSTVSESGRFAFFQGTLGDEKEVEIALGISSSAQAYIKGSCGIGAFVLDVKPPVK